MCNQVFSIIEILAANSKRQASVRIWVITRLEYKRKHFLVALIGMIPISGFYINKTLIVKSIVLLYIHISNLCTLRYCHFILSDL